MSADGASEEARRTDEDLAHVCVISVYGRGEQMKMSLPKSTSIEEMRRLIREKAGDDAEFRLIHGGRCLLDGETLGDAVRLGQDGDRAVLHMVHSTCPPTISCPSPQLSIDFVEEKDEGADLISCLYEQQHAALTRLFSFAQSGNASSLQQEALLLGAGGGAGGSGGDIAFGHATVGAEAAAPLEIGLPADEMERILAAGDGGSGEDDRRERPENAMMLAGLIDIRLALHLSFFVLLLSQDGHPGRVSSLGLVAVAYYLLKTGAVGVIWRLVSGSSMRQETRRTARRLSEGAIPIGPSGGVLSESMVFFCSFFLSLFPPWHPHSNVGDLPEARPHQ